MRLVKRVWKLDPFFVDAVTVLLERRVQQRHGKICFRLSLLTIRDVGSDHSGSDHSMAGP